MDLSPSEEATRLAVAAAETVVPVGAGTHREVGGPVPIGTEVGARRGIVTYDPAELTVTAWAGTTVAELDATLGEHRQECVLDPRDPAATLGGVLAVGLSGHRRLRYGPLRDRVLEVRFVTADGRIVRGGGPTVKNVTGFDLPRLLVGSYGTIGVLTRVILRCQPRPRGARWYRAAGPPAHLRGRLVAPSAILGTRETSTVLLEGDPSDVDAQADAAELEPTDGPPPWPHSQHRGRVSVAPGRLGTVAVALDQLDGVTWLAEWGVGTVHVAADTPAGLAAARAAAVDSGGWLLREAGAPDLDGFGGPLPNATLLARVKAAFDPTGKLAPGRLPIPALAPNAVGS